MEPERKAKRIRILSGTVPEVEEALNRMLDEYAAIVWSFVAAGDHVQVTVVLIAISEMRMQALAQGGARVRMQ